MKRYIYYIWCLLGLGLLTGCMFEEESIETEDDNLVHMVFTAMVEDGNPATRTVLDENEVDGFRGVLWEPEDVIGIATYNGRYQRFENVLEEPAASGVFEGSVNQDIMYYAIYPYRDNQQMGSSVNVTIPSKQTYQPDSFDGSAAPMVGKGNHAEPLHFMNLCGALAVQLTGNEKVRSIIFQANANDKVSGDGTVDPDYGDYPVLQMGDLADNFIILDCGEGVQLSGTPTSFHFVLPPGTYNGFKLIISTTDGQFMEKSTDKQLKIKRSIVTKAASFAFENTATNFTDLSERGTANSYIVTQGGYYSFDATVIGNGEFGFPANNNYHTNSPEIAPASAELLWADNHNLINGCGYDASTGMLKFLTSGDEGNAVIAAKDSEGNILWSWHIWMTDQPEEQVYNNNAGTLMDRNLGATSATPGDVGALGLLYQWGRKDPFLGSASISGAVERESTITWPSPVSSDAENGTIGYSVLNPTTFIKSNGSNDDWYYTGSSSTDDTRWQSDKTIYDPCPSGWRVPEGEVWATATFEDIGYDNTNRGRLFNISSPATSWYPSSGYRGYNGDLCEIGNGGRYWSVSCSGNYATYLDFGTSYVYPEYNLYRVFGFSLRCTKDDGYVDISYPQVKISSFEDITTSSAKLVALVKSEGVSPVTERGFIYGTQPDLSDGTKVQCGEGGGEFSYDLTGLPNATKYYVKAYAVNSRGETQTEIAIFMTHVSDDIIDLSAKGTANSYIISNSGTFSINAVKGNSSESVGAIVSSDILWESYGTEEVPVVGTLVSSTTIEGDLIVFDVPEPYHEGNAVIAVKDASGEILWSWHIWLTDQPQAHVYNNNAGTMMDRNLGATSATPGDVGALGLLYQWGRKDPFLGSASISSGVEAQSTITWPSPVYSDSSNGTIEYAISHPTTFIKYYYYIGRHDDWYYTGSSSTDDTRWQSDKTIYDPCPSGWRVPDGGSNGVWATAMGSSSGYDRSYDSTNKGMNFSGDFGSASTIWYPASGSRYYNDGALYQVGYDGSYWSASPYSDNAYRLNFSNGGDVRPTSSSCRAHGYSVRCLKEGTGGGYSYDQEFSIIDATTLSDNGTANSYIVSSAGTYSFPTVKGNSAESVGSVSSASVLWESYGTDVRPSKGDLIKAVKYENERIYIKTSDTYREGNAIIAAQDANGTVLWSWHIWLTDEPEGQIYNNNAGTMMDRNLGATSATPGDVGALGLLYQWGRKDPFLGSSSISSDIEARSTITWPSPVSSDSSNGTIEYAISHPTTFINSNSINLDWYYTGSSSTDDTRWQSEKTIYDPCPTGWRVPDGGDEGVWSAAKGSSSSYNRSYDSTNKGMNFSGDFGSASTIWYPASGCRGHYDGALINVGGGYFWSVTPDSYSACTLDFYSSGNVNPTSNSNRACGFSVRCLQESE